MASSRRPSTTSRAATDSTGSSRSPARACSGAAIRSRRSSVGQAGVGQPALDAVAEQRGERLAGGDALEQLQRLAHARRRQVEVERVLGARGPAGRCAAAPALTAWAERRRGDVPEAVGAPDRGRGGGPRPSRSTRGGRRGPIGAQLGEAGGGERREPGVEARAEQVEHAAERPLQLVGRCRREHVEGGEEAGEAVDRARRRRDVLAQRRRGAGAVATRSCTGDVACPARSRRRASRAESNCSGSRCGSGSSTRTRSGVRTPLRTKPAAARSSTERPSTSSADAALSSSCMAAKASSASSRAIESWRRLSSRRPSSPWRASAAISAT